MACEYSWTKRKTKGTLIDSIEFTAYRPLEEVVAKKTKQQWDPDLQLISPLSTPASGLSFKRKKCIVDDPMDFVDVETLSNWNLNDLTAAGKLLRKPPLPCHFDDEHEMRRVYSMIYDVYRCKLCPPKETKNTQTKSKVWSNAIIYLNFHSHFADICACNFD